jgi:hypothetical protein
MRNRSAISLMPLMPPEMERLWKLIKVDCGLSDWSCCILVTYVFLYRQLINWSTDEAYYRETCLDKLCWFVICLSYMFSERTLTFHGTNYLSQQNVTVWLRRNNIYSFLGFLSHSNTVKVTCGLFFSCDPQSIISGTSKHLLFVFVFWFYVTSTQYRSYRDVPVLLVEEDLRCPSVHYFRHERVPE